MQPPRIRKYRLARSVFTSPEARRRTVAWLFALGIAVFALTAFIGRFFPWLTDPAALRATFEAAGPYAPALFVIIQAGQVVVAPIPGQVLGFVSGYLFGTTYGTIYSLLGATLGSYVVFRLSRQYGRRQVERAIDPELVEQFDAVIQRHGLFALFAVFLVPGLPDDVVCFVAGLTDLRIRDMLVVSVVGRLPGYFLVNAAGARLEAGDVTTSVGLVAALVVLFILGYFCRGPLLGRLAGSSEVPDGCESQDHEEFDGN